ncbi:proto-oncogene tyrosine-protein kinase receptor Ret isoform X2 [Drosophila gunungcola]|uniref:proto-oncogene tyrosine-protein kinase receptor Ret isoform X2 n=1 Tax=Drosophila gunungcola TaxID=103775 RepID=UPI0022DEF301|nr:proto-oncogene tyrosine-protein kinase receptor Ret isoform X2 [Drosophila gunungcola]
MESFIIIIVMLLTIVTQQQHNCAAVDVYFPSTSVKFNLPINEESESIFSKIPLAQFQVLRTESNRLASDYLYSLEENPLLRINSSSGEIYMRTDYRSPNASVKYVVTAFPRDQPDHELLPVTHLTLEVMPQPLEDYCAELEHICFWSSAQYSIAESQGEHRRRDSFEPVLIGALNSRAAKYLCPHVSLEYSLNAGSSHFVLKQNRLYTRQPLDHDELNGLNAKAGQLQARIICTVKLSARDHRKFTRSFDIKLLDRNDNGPKLQESDSKFEFYLEQPYFQADEEAGKKIIYVDKDTLAANSHLVYAVHNDSNGLFRPDCHAYEADHTGRPHTIVSCQLRFSRSGVLRESPYCVSLEARDLTIETQNDAMSATAHICFRINLGNLHETDQELPQALPLRSRQHRIFENEDFNGDAASRSLGSLTVDYEKDVSVYRTAASYYRIVQPESFLDLMRFRSIRFDIVEDKIGAFGITPTSGIVYVKNPHALEEAPETIYFLNVTWMDQQRLSHVRVINVHLVHGRPENTSCELKIKSRSQTCAQVKFPTQCSRFCGLATGGASCQWRGSNSAMFGSRYGSCVPESRYCPDHVCDPLEELNPMACPQDCTPAGRIMGPHTSNENKRGIYSASGTCTCEDNGKCSCAPLDDEPKVKKPRKRKNETEAEPLLSGKRGTPAADPSLQDPLLLGVLNVAGFECDRSCMFFVITCPLLFVLLLLCLLIAQRKMLQRRLGKQSMTPSAKQALPELGDGDFALMPLQSGFKFESGDTKWEFPRDKLQLDTVLGEGEFGQVLKGYATEIAGLPGITTVAVKMLKKGANSVEYMALLSEFQLLQEVSHPNVIKLLGACTSSEAPLLIIEYARYGSLRSYLRLSRKIECAGVDFADGVEPVNVKMVLTFAWQICKGMAYLTELKLVHRDLAARNVLLADGKICKISDFGLTRDVYEDDAYLKRSRDRVPVKWMAPESLADHVYTSKSDVWSFGVLCWELITLGASPYPGIAPQNLWSLLKTGYRMDRPENCSEAVYSIVRTCWADEPNGRPSFKFLASEFEKLLGNNAKYIDLETNAVSNPLYCGDDSALMTTEFGEPESLQHLWSPPKIAYDIHDQGTSYDQSEEEMPVTSAAPPGYDLPRPLIDATAKEQVLRYENDLRFPLNIRKSSCTPSYSNMTSGSAAATSLPHYSVPVKRGRSYLDMTNKSLIPDNLDSREFEKHLSKTISFRFSSLLNLKETAEADPGQQAEDVV